jgi:hypothetical protein
VRKGDSNPPSNACPTTCRDLDAPRMEILPCHIGSCSNISPRIFSPQYYPGFGVVK